MIPWQHAWRGSEQGTRREEIVRLIALVNDAGVGKTSLLCAFVASLAPCLPVLLLQARHYTFDTEDCISRAVIQSLQGVLAPELVREEEAAIAHHIPMHCPLTIILDGLDEAGNPTAVRRAIRFWLQSRLGQRSLLILSARREFWQACVDRAWCAWIPSLRQADRRAVTPAERAELQLHDPAQGLQLPGLFSPKELERAWVLAGQPLAALYVLTPEVREELRHPFTLRAFVSLQGHKNIGLLRTRVDIMETWIKVRLQVEEDRAARLTTETYRFALLAIANAVAHRDYSSYARGSYIQIRMFADRLEVQSPGGLFGNVTVDNIEEEHSTRNARLMRMMEDMHLVENRGSGIKAMLYALRAANLEPPMFDDRRSSFKVTFRNHTLMNPEAIAWLNQFADLPLNDRQRLALVYLRQHQQLNNRDYRRLNRVDAILAGQDLRGLVDTDMIVQEGVGRWTRYRLNVAPELPEQRQPQTDADRLVAHVRQTGSITNSQVQELLGVDDTRAYYLLKKLCDAGRLKPEGQGKWRQYVLP